jgi:spore coat polysaccharide biosynthesis protein SpsF
MLGNSIKELGRTVAIVQARMGSSRLPGKMMMGLCGKPLLFWVLSRVKKSTLIGSVLLATSDKVEDDPLEEVAFQLHVPVFRGSENDVLGRFRKAAKSVSAEKIIRICGDNPLIAPEEIDRLVASYSSILKQGNCSERLYAFNYGPQMGNNYPDGLGGEMFSFKLLQKLDKLVLKPRHREHVCAYIWDNLDEFEIHSFQPPKEIAFPDIKLDVDTKEDLNKLNILCNQLNLESSAVEIVKAYNKIFNKPD